MNDPRRRRTPDSSRRSSRRKSRRDSREEHHYHHQQQQQQQQQQYIVLDEPRSSGPGSRSIPGRFPDDTTGETTSYLDLRQHHAPPPPLAYFPGPAAAGMHVSAEPGPRPVPIPSDLNRPHRRVRRRGSRSSLGSSSSSLSSASTGSGFSSSYLDISRWYPSWGRGGSVLKTFFKTPSEHRPRRRRSQRSKKTTKKCGGVFGSHNSSSSSVNSDMAYGMGFIKRPKRSRGGRFGSNHMAASAAVANATVAGSVFGRTSRAEGSRLGRQRRQTDEEILDIGMKLQDVAKMQSRADMERHSRSSYERSQRQSCSGMEASVRGLSPSGPRRRHHHHGSSSSDDEWESASEGDDSDELSALAYGHSPIHTPRPAKPSTSRMGTASAIAAGSALVAGSAIAAAARKPDRQPAVVDPQLFGPTNSLRDCVNTPCGFAGDMHDSAYAPLDQLQGYAGSAYGASLEAARPLQTVVPVATSDPGRMDTVRETESVVSSSQQQQQQQRDYASTLRDRVYANTAVSNRPEPVPIQAPKPIAPVPSQIYYGDEHIHDTGPAPSELTKYKERRRKPSSDDKRYAETALVGAGVAALGAAFLAGRGRDQGKGKAVEDDDPELRHGRHEKYGHDDHREGDIKVEDARKAHELRLMQEIERLEQRLAKTSEAREVRRRDSKRARGSVSRVEGVSADVKGEKDYERERETRRQERKSRRSEPLDRDSRVSAPSERPAAAVLEDGTRSGRIANSMQPGASASIDVFQFQVPDDAFMTGNTPPKAPSPYIIDVTPTPSPVPSPPPEQSGRRSSQHDAYDEGTRDAHYIYQQAHHSTAPIPKAVMAAAFGAVENLRRRTNSRTKSCTTDIVQQEADKVYAARRLAEREIHSGSRSKSKDSRSVLEKYADEGDDEIVQLPRILTPPEWKNRPPKNQFSEPNADFRFDELMSPTDLLGYRAAHAPVRDPSAERPRPVLNLVMPTPSPERQGDVAAAKVPEPVQEVPKVEAPIVRFGPRGEVIEVYEVAEEPATAPTPSKRVSWGPSETKQYEERSPERIERPSSSLAKMGFGGWGAIAAAVTGAGVGAALAKGSETKSPKHDERSREVSEDRRSSDSRSPHKEWAVVSGISSRVLREEPEELPPAPGPKPASPRSPQHMPGAFNADIDFAATLAAGLEHSGFDPEIVIENPVYRRRDSPPGSNAPYTQPFAETVSDLGIYNDDYVSRPFPRDHGYVIGEVDTPGSEKAAPLDDIEDVSSRGKGKRSSSIYDDIEVIEKSEAAEPDASNLSKKERRKLEKAAQASKSVEEEVQATKPQAVASGEDDWADASTSSKKSKKSTKSKKATRSSVAWDDADTPVNDTSVSVPVHAFDDIKDDEVEERDTPQKYKKSKRSSKGYELPDDGPPDKDKQDRRTAEFYEPVDRDVASVSTDSRHDAPSKGNGNGDDNRSVASAPSGSKQDNKRSGGGFWGLLSGKDQQQSSKKDNAGTLGAGAGLAGVAAVAIAAAVAVSNAAEAPSDHGQEEPHNEGNAREEAGVIFEDLEITPRVIKPAIDPQYGDLLPLPPTPGEDVLEFDEDKALPSLPDSRPTTPPGQVPMLLRERANTSTGAISPSWKDTASRSAKRPHVPSHARRTSTDDRAVRSPSNTAIPIQFRMGHRSLPAAAAAAAAATSPAMGGGSHSGPTTPAQETSPTFKRVDFSPTVRRQPPARPTTWDSSREIKPLYLLKRSARAGGEEELLRDEVAVMTPLPPSGESPVLEGEGVAGEAVGVGVDAVPFVVDTDLARAAALGTQEFAPTGPRLQPVEHSPSLEQESEGEATPLVLPSANSIPESSYAIPGEFPSCEAGTISSPKPYPLPIEASGNKEVHKKDKKSSFPSALSMLPAATLAGVGVLLGHGKKEEAHTSSDAHEDAHDNKLEADGPSSEPTDLPAEDIVRAPSESAAADDPDQQVLSSPPSKTVELPSLLEFQDALTEFSPATSSKSLSEAEDILPETPVDTADWAGGTGSKKKKKGKKKKQSVSDASQRLITFADAMPPSPDMRQDALAQGEASLKSMDEPANDTGASPPLSTSQLTRSKSPETMCTGSEQTLLEHSTPSQPDVIGVPADTQPETAPDVEQDQRKSCQDLALSLPGAYLQEPALAHAGPLSEDVPTQTTRLEDAVTILPTIVEDPSPAQPEISGDASDAPTTSFTDPHFHSSEFVPDASPKTVELVGDDWMATASRGKKGKKGKKKNKKQCISLAENVLESPTPTTTHSEDVARDVHESGRVEDVPSVPDLAIPSREMDSSADTGKDAELQEPPEIVAQPLDSEAVHHDAAQQSQVDTHGLIGEPAFVRSTDMQLGESSRDVSAGEETMPPVEPADTNEPHVSQYLVDEPAHARLTEAQPSESLRDSSAESVAVSPAIHTDELRPDVYQFLDDEPSTNSPVQQNSPPHGTSPIPASVEEVDKMIQTDEHRPEVYQFLDNEPSTDSPVQQNSPPHGTSPIPAMVEEVDKMIQTDEHRPDVYQFLDNEPSTNAPVQKNSPPHGTSPILAFVKEGDDVVWSKASNSKKKHKGSDVQSFGDATPEDHEHVDLPPDLPRETAAFAADEPHPVQETQNMVTAVYDSVVPGHAEVLPTSPPVDKAAQSPQPLEDRTLPAQQDFKPESLPLQGLHFPTSPVSVAHDPESKSPSEDAKLLDTSAENTSAVHVPKSESLPENVKPLDTSAEKPEDNKPLGVDSELDRGNLPSGVQTETTVGPAQDTLADDIPLPTLETMSVAEKTFEPEPQQAQALRDEADLASREDDIPTSGPDASALEPQADYKEPLIEEEIACRKTGAAHIQDEETEPARLQLKRKPSKKDKARLKDLKARAQQRAEDAEVAASPSSAAKDFEQPALEPEHVDQIEQGVPSQSKDATCIEEPVLVERGDLTQVSASQESTSPAESPRLADEEVGSFQASDEGAQTGLQPDSQQLDDSEELARREAEAGLICDEETELARLKNKNKRNSKDKSRLRTLEANAIGREREAEAAAQRQSREQTVVTRDTEDEAQSHTNLRQGITPDPTEEVSHPLVADEILEDVTQPQGEVSAAASEKKHSKDLSSTLQLAHDQLASSTPQNTHAQVVDAPEDQTNHSAPAKSGAPVSSSKKPKSVFGGWGTIAAAISGISFGASVAQDSEPRQIQEGEARSEDQRAEALENVTPSDSEPQSFQDGMPQATIQEHPNVAENQDAELHLKTLPTNTADDSSSYLEEPAPLTASGPDDKYITAPALNPGSDQELVTEAQPHTQSSISTKKSEKHKKKKKRKGTLSGDSSQNSGLSSLLETSEADEAAKSVELAEIGPATPKEDQVQPIVGSEMLPADPSETAGPEPLATEHAQLRDNVADVTPQEERVLPVMGREPSSIDPLATAQHAVETVILPEPMQLGHEVVNVASHEDQVPPFVDRESPSVDLSATAPQAFEPANLPESVQLGDDVGITVLQEEQVLPSVDREIPPVESADMAQHACGPPRDTFSEALASPIWEEPMGDAQGDTSRILKGLDYRPADDAVRSNSPTMPPSLASEQEVPLGELMNLPAGLARSAEVAPFSVANVHSGFEFEPSIAKQEDSQQLKIAQHGTEQPSTSGIELIPLAGAMPDSPAEDQGPSAIEVSQDLPHETDPKTLAKDEPQPLQDEEYSRAPAKKSSKKDKKKKKRGSVTWSEPASGAQTPISEEAAEPSPPGPSQETSTIETTSDIARSLPQDACVMQVPYSQPELDDRSHPSSSQKKNQSSTSSWEPETSSQTPMGDKPREAQHVIEEASKSHFTTDNCLVTQPMEPPQQDPDSILEPEKKAGRGDETPSLLSEGTDQLPLNTDMKPGAVAKLTPHEPTAKADLIIAIEQDEDTIVAAGGQLPGEDLPLASEKVVTQSPLASCPPPTVTEHAVASEVLPELELHSQVQDEGNTVLAGERAAHHDVPFTSEGNVNLPSLSEPIPKSELVRTVGDGEDALVVAGAKVPDEATCTKSDLEAQAGVDHEIPTAASGQLPEEAARPSHTHGDSQAHSQLGPGSTSGSLAVSRSVSRTESPAPWVDEDGDYSSSQRDLHLGIGQPVSQSASPTSQEVEREVLPAQQKDDLSDMQKSALQPDSPGPSEKKKSGFVTPFEQSTALSTRPDRMPEMSLKESTEQKPEEVIIPAVEKQAVSNTVESMADDVDDWTPENSTKKEKRKAKKHNASLPEPDATGMTSDDLAQKDFVDKDQDVPSEFAETVELQDGGAQTDGHRESSFPLPEAAAVAAAVAVPVLGRELSKKEKRTAKKSTLSWEDDAPETSQPGTTTAGDTASRDMPILASPAAEPESNRGVARDIFPTGPQEGHDVPTSSETSSAVEAVAEDAWTAPLPREKSNKDKKKGKQLSLVTASGNQTPTEKKAPLFTSAEIQESPKTVDRAVEKPLQPSGEDIRVQPSPTQASTAERPEGLSDAQLKPTSPIIPGSELQKMASATPSPDIWDSEDYFKPRSPGHSPAHSAEKPWDKLEVHPAFSRGLSSNSENQNREERPFVGLGLFHRHSSIFQEGDGHTPKLLTMTSDNASVESLAIEEASMPVQYVTVPSPGAQQQQTLSQSPRLSPKPFSEDRPKSPLPEDVHLSRPGSVAMLAQIFGGRTKKESGQGSTSPALESESESQIGNDNVSATHSPPGQGVGRFTPEISEHAARHEKFALGSLVESPVLGSQASFNVPSPEPQPQPQPQRVEHSASQTSQPQQQQKPSNIADTWDLIGSRQRRREPSSPRPDSSASDSKDMEEAALSPVDFRPSVPRALPPVQEEPTEEEVKPGKQASTLTPTNADINRDRDSGVHMRNYGDRSPGLLSSGSSSPDPNRVSRSSRAVPNTRMARVRTPEPLPLNLPAGSGTPPLPLRSRRTRSGDLRTLSQSRSSVATAASLSPATGPAAADPPVADPPVADLPVADPPVADPPVADPPVAASTSAIDLRKAPNPVANEGRVRTKDMADVYDGFGEGRMGSPRSPTRPHSMRRRQSLQVLDLENRVEQLLAENRALAEAKALADLHSTNRVTSSLAERDNEIEALKQSLDFMRKEIHRLTEVNEGLNSAISQSAVQHQDRYRLLETEHAALAGELHHFRSQQGSYAQTVQDKDAEISSLREQLEATKEQVRELQRQILATNPATSDFLQIRDVDYFDHRCQQLYSHLQQWVLRFSKFSDMRACRLTGELDDEKIIDRLDNTVLDGSNVDNYLNDRVRRRDIFMSLAVTMIWEFVFTRYLFGMDREQRQKLKALEKLLQEVGPSKAIRQWRAVTLTLLSKRDGFKDQREKDTEAVVQAVLQTLSTILPPPTNLEAQIQGQLRRVMREAVDLSIEMRTQRAEYMMLPPLMPEYDASGDLAEPQPFNAQLMSVRSSGDHRSNKDSQSADGDLQGEGAIVRIVLFPLVVKKGDDEGVGDDEVVVCPAQVIVRKPGRRSSSSRSMHAPSSDAGGVSLLRGGSPSTAPNQSNVSMAEAEYIEGGF